MLSYQVDLHNMMRRRTAAILLTMGLSVTITVLTLVPLHVPSGVPGTDKIHHVVAFAALTLPCATLYPKALVRVALAAAFFGGAIEIIQPYVGRSGELADLIADLLGIGVGVVVGILFNLALRMRAAQRQVRS